MTRINIQRRSVQLGPLRGTTPKEYFTKHITTKETFKHLSKKVTGDLLQLFSRHPERDRVNLGSVKSESKNRKRNRFDPSKTTLGEVISYSINLSTVHVWNHIRDINISYSVIHIFLLLTTLPIKLYIRHLKWKNFPNNWFVHRLIYVSLLSSSIYRWWDWITPTCPLVKKNTW